MVQGFWGFVGWDLGFGVWGLGFGVWGLGFGVWGLGFGLGVGGWGFGVCDLGFRVRDVGFGALGLGFRVRGLRFRVWPESPPAARTSWPRDPEVQEMVQERTFKGGGSTEEVQESKRAVTDGIQREHTKGCPRVTREREREREREYVVASRP